LFEALDSEFDASDDSLASPLLRTRGDGVASDVDGALRGSLSSSSIDGVNEFDRSADRSADTNDMVGEKAFMQRRAKLYCT